MTKPIQHLITTKNLDKKSAIKILDTTENMFEKIVQKKQKLDSLKNHKIANLFFEDSTRTKLSFEIATKNLSAQTINFTPKGSSLSKGENLKDTVQTLQAMGANAIIIRHQACGAAQYLAQSSWTKIPIINAGDGKHQHPTQALLDAYTIRKNLKPKTSTTNTLGKDLQNTNIVIVGDILHSRVARSNIYLLHTLGAKITLVAAPTMLPKYVETWPVKISYNFDETLKKHPDVVMMLRIQKERMQDNYFPNNKEYTKYWGLNLERIKLLSKNTLILHPGPINRDLEISTTIADAPQTKILEQVTNGIYVRMAVLELILSPKHTLFEGK